MESLFYCMFLVVLCSAYAQHIVIVGGGVSGLSAARKLCESNLCNITILEAKNRVGGRVYSYNYLGNVIELGAQYIHGTTGNPVYELLSKEINLATYENLVNEDEENGTVIPIFASGRKVSDDIYDLFEESFYFAGYTAAYPYRQIGEKKVSVDKLKTVSVFEVSKKVWKNVYLKGYDYDKSDTDTIFNFVVCEMQVDDGAHPRNVGILLYYYFKDFKGPVIRLPKYSALIDIMLRTIPDSSIKLNSEVKSIRWKEDGAKNQSVVVDYYNANGENVSIDADYVIFTPSLGYLKAHHRSIFIPNLPKNKQNAIELMGFGTINKLFLYYNTNFWSWSDEVMHIGILWDSYNGNDEFADENHWARHLHYCGEYDNNTLILWLDDKASQALYNVTKKSISSTITKLLQKLLEDKSIPEPDDVIVTHWEDEKHFLGSYSFMALGETQETRKILSEPLYVNDVPRVFFAGEATHLARFSTVDGAFSSGIREADKIVKLEKSGSSSFQRKQAVIWLMLSMTKLNLA